MAVKKQNVWVLGSRGMLGHQVCRVFSEHPGYKTFGVWTSKDFNDLLELWASAPPGIVINCIGVTPRHPDYADPTKVFSANAVLPHKLLAACLKYHARLIHVSTDCVFLGAKGNYSENDTPDALDTYGVSKLIGEVDAPALTLRTSLIGPELHTKRGLLEWFLSQKDLVTGYSHHIFSGLTTLEFAQVLRDHVVPNPVLHGLFHVGGDPISKYDLLRQIHTEYKLDVKLARGQGPPLDRSLDSRRFQLCTGYKPPSWPQMIREMHNAH